VTRRTVLLVGGASLLAVPTASASTLSITRDLRKMVGFHIVGVDDVRQAWKSHKPPAGRFIELRQLGLFKETTITPRLDPIAHTEVIVFARAYGPSLRQQYPGLAERVYYDYRLLIDGEFYHCVGWD
jgi:hypothetical protein